MIPNSRPNSGDASSDPMRNSVRFPLHFQVDVETRQGTLRATTEDISSSGVLFHMETAPEVNERVTWTMVLPASVLGAAADVMVHCVGRVVWNRPGSGFRQVGTVIDSYRIVEAHR